MTLFFSILIAVAVAILVWKVLKAMTRFVIVVSLVVIMVVAVVYFVPSILGFIP